MSALVLFAANETAATSLNEIIDPIKLYGKSHEFSVLRDGIPVGRHIVSFSKEGDAVRARSNFNVKITFLGLSLYDFDYRSDALWSEGKLNSIEIRIDDDGTHSSINAIQKAPTFTVIGETHSITKSSEIFPTNHWNKKVLTQTSVFNTLTGKMNAVTITSVGEETVAVRGGTIRAMRYDYDGELRLSSWYDRKGRWVKMKFKAEDNSDMVYFCETCPVEIGSSE
jgi:hypothetical protein